jgi:hemerythrin-like domain-containing protein
MKTATRNLEDDHIHILKLTEVMRSVTRFESPDIKHIEKIIVIIKNYADGLHHAKEESLLFPAMESKGFSPVQGPVAVMLHEHDQGRIFVKGIADNLESFKKGDLTAKDEMYRNMSGYAELLTNHIAKENNVLFRLADKAFSDKEQENLLLEFEKIEEARSAGTTVNDYIDQITTLAGFYKV